MSLNSHSSALLNFIGNLFAGLIILLVGSFVVPQYLDYRRRPHLVIKNHETRGENFFLEPANINNEAIGNFRIVVRNEGQRAEKDWYWHLIAPDEIDPQLVPVQGGARHGWEPIYHNGSNWRHFMGRSMEPVYEGSGYLFPFMLNVTSKKPVQSYAIFYYFSTEFGTWPPKAKDIEKIIQNPDVVFGSKYLGRINIHPEGNTKT